MSTFGTKKSFKFRTWNLSRQLGIAGESLVLMWRLLILESNITASSKKMDVFGFSCPFVSIHAIQEQFSAQPIEIEKSPNSFELFFSRLYDSSRVDCLTYWSTSWWSCWRAATEQARTCWATIRAFVWMIVPSMWLFAPMRIMSQFVWQTEHKEEGSDDKFGPGRVQLSQFLWTILGKDNYPLGTRCDPFGHLWGMRTQALLFGAFIHAASRLDIASSQGS